MKLKYPLLGALLAAAYSSFAQQMVSPPGQIAASPEPATESIPDTTPAPTPEAVEKPAVPPESTDRVATPAPKTRPVVSKPARVSKPVKPKIARKAEPAPTEPAAVEAQDKRGVAATLKDLEKKWEKAIVAHNTAEVAALVAPDFAGVNAKGKFMNKLALISELKKDKDQYESARSEKLNVHVYGPDIAVVTGSVRSKGTSKAGQSFDRTYRYTDTWVRRDGRWQCVASQDGLVSGN